MSKSDRKIEFALGETPIWRMFIYSLRPLVVLQDSTERGYLLRVALMTFVVSSFTFLPGFLFVKSYPLYLVIYHILIFLPGFYVPIILSKILPSEKLYWILIIQVVNAFMGGMLGSLAENSIYAPVFFPYLGLIYIAIAFQSPLFPKVSLISAVLLWVSLAFAKYFLIPQTDLLELSWILFNIWVCVSVFIALGVGAILNETANTIVLRESQIHDLKQTNALLNITLSHNNFGLAGFNKIGDLVLERGARLSRLLTPQLDIQRYQNIFGLKWEMEKRFNFDFEKLKYDFVEIEHDGQYFLLRSYDIHDMIILSHMEVTKIRTVEEELRARQKLSVIGEITSGVAHNYNNALAIALANLEAFPETTDEHLIKEYVEPTIRAIETSSDISRKLLTLAGRQNLKLTVFDVSTTLNSMENLIHSAIGSDVALSIDCEPSLFIETDIREFEAAILNLLINARNAVSRQSGKIQVYARKNNNKIIVSVKDNGAGISPEIADKIFDPFFTTKPNRHSTGLGLSTVKGFVEQSKGRVKMRSSESGSEFLIYFPAVKKTKTPEQRNTRKGSNSAINSQELILLVDDNEQVLGSFERLLDKMGFATIACKSPIEAITVFSQNPNIRIAFLDLTMPDMNGIELGKKLIEQQPDIALYLITGEMGSENFDAARSAGFQEVILKPVKAKKLAELIKKSSKSETDRRLN